MADKKPTEWFDPKELDKEEVPIEFSTEWTESEDDFIYKRYKLAYIEVKQKLKDYQYAI